MMQNTWFNVKEAYLVAKKNQAFLVISMSIHFLMTFKYYVIYSHQLLKFYVISNKGSLLEKKTYFGKQGFHLKSMENIFL